jgi:hypothetical protein
LPLSFKRSHHNVDFLLLPGDAGDALVLGEGIMNEKQWLASKTVAPMVKFIRGQASDRQLRLFACACCRRIWPFMKDAIVQAAVEVGERLADDKASPDELKTARNLDPQAIRVRYLPNAAFGHAANAAREVVLFGCNAASAADHCALAIFQNAHHASRVEWAAGLEEAKTALQRDYAKAQEGEAAAQAVLLRDIIGNPFRPTTANSAWLTQTVTHLAEAIYTDRAFDRLPILADALEDAGCDNAAILEHCRQPGEHARGCWVVDLILAKK